MNNVVSEEEAREATLEYFSGDELAADVAVKKYLLRDIQGNLVEKTPDDIHHRLAKEFARIESNYPDPLTEDEIYNLMKDFKEIIPQGSLMSGIGNNFQIQSLSNCQILPDVIDSYGGIMQQDEWLVQLSKRRCGLGFDISGIRPKGLPTQNSSRTTDGIAVFMERYSRSVREVGQGGRRAALLLSISCHHPEIRTFINIKKNGNAVWGANISIRITDEFLNCVKNKEKVQLRFPVDKNVPHKVEEWVDANELWDEIIASAHAAAEPGLLFDDTIRKYTPSDAFTEEGHRFVSTNPCFAPGTMILTKQGHFPIEDLVGKEVEVWDGLNWVKCNNFRITGENQPVLKITMQDGSFTRVTPYHICILNTGRKVKANELQPGMRLQISETPLIDGQHIERGAYIKGFLTGDGAYDAESEIPLLWVYHTKYSCMPRLINSAREIPAMTIGRRDSIITEPSFGKEDKAKRRSLRGLTCRDYELYSWVTEYKQRLPKGIFNWSVESKHEFIAGVFDADGTAQDSAVKGFHYQLASINKNWLYDIQQLLKTIGVYSKMSLMRKGGVTDFKHRGGVLKVVDCWRLTIPQKYSIKLAAQVIFSRLVSFQDKKLVYNLKPFYNKIVSIENDGIEKKVYCCTVPTTHSLSLSSGNHWGNCGEVPSGAFSSCRLMALNLTSFVRNSFTQNAFFDFERFYAVNYKAQKLMDDTVDLELEAIQKIFDKINSDPEPASVKRNELELWENILRVSKAERRVGLGVTGLGDCLAMLNIKYGSDASISMTEQIYKTLATANNRSSIAMAKERGAFPSWKPGKWDTHPFMQRLIEADPDCKDDLLKYGRRGICLTTTAPTGSLSTLTQTTSGIEPAYLLLYNRRRKVPKEQLHDFVDPVGDCWQTYTVEHHGVKKWKEVTGETDTTKSPYFGATANDIDWVQSVKLQAAAQKYVELAISKTCNLPENVSVDTVKQVYMTAWKSGCKGVTVYRDKSRTGVLIAKDDNNTKFTQHNAPKRPQSLPCDIHQFNLSNNKWVILVGLLDGKPYEVFGGLAKHIGFTDSPLKGTITKRSFKTKNARYDLEVGGQVIEDIANTFDNVDYAALTRMVSLSLRHGANIQYVVEQLLKEKDASMFTMAKSLARTLKHYISEGAKASIKLCESCGAGGTLIYQEGCVKCSSCSFSRC